MYMMCVFLFYGKIYIGNCYFCFCSLLLGICIKFVFLFKDIENVDKEKGFWFGYVGLVVVICGYEEFFFEFNWVEICDDCIIMVL